MEAPIAKGKDLEKPLRVLVVEDCQADATILLLTLRQGGYNPVAERVDGADAMRKALQNEPWDIIICDYVLPGFAGMEALRILKESGRDVPFIMVSGKVGEETAVAALKAGADDFVMKGNLGRLVPAVEKELANYAFRCAAEAAIGRRLELRASIAAISLRFVGVFDLDEAINDVLATIGKFSHASRAYLCLFRDDGLVMDNTCEWCDAGAVSLKDSLENLPLADIPWWVDNLQRTKAIVINDVATMPAEANLEKRIFQERDIRSLIAVGVLLSDKLVGFMGFDSWGLLRTWNDEDLSILSVSCQIIGNALERRRVEEALRKSERKYRRLFEDSRDIVFLTTPEGKFLDINPSGVRLFGYNSKEEMLHLHIPTDLYVDATEREKLSQALQAQEFVGDREVTLKRKDGAELQLVVNASVVREHGVIVAYQGIIRDMTEHKKLEQQLLQAQKMETVGALAGGVAHDFNNILTGVIGFAELGLARVPYEDPLYQYLDQIKKQGYRGAALARQLLAFSSKQVLERRNTDLNRIVLDLQKFLQQVIGENIELKVITTPEPRTVLIDPAQIEQTLMNLCVNARDAMPGGGRLAVEVKPVALDDDFCRLNPWSQPGPYIRLSVTDTGIGMSRKIMDHIFEPFFTTKPKGKGTGLGLATVYGIVKQHEALIHALSREGKGSTFDIYFKPAPGPVDPKGHGREKPPLPAGHETILLAEDEDSVRELLTTVLQGQGYTVFAAKDGEEALRLFETNRGNLQLAILDLVMPKMGGYEVYEDVLHQEPGCKFLFVSGYAEQQVTRQLISRAGVNYLQKPFSPMDLRYKVREILDKPDT